MQQKTDEEGLQMEASAMQDVELIIAHCFDNRPIWARVWIALCLVYKWLQRRLGRRVRVLRIPLAGASAKGKHYERHLREIEADPDIPIVFATHWRCGWFGNAGSPVILAHAREVVNFLIAEGRKVIHLHFEEVVNEHHLRCRIYDPLGMVNTDEVVAEVVRIAQEFNGQAYDDAELLPTPTPNAVMADYVYGPPPTDELVIHSDFVVGKTVKVLCHLNGCRPVTIRAVGEYDTTERQEAAS